MVLSSTIRPIKLSDYDEVANTFKRLGCHEFLKMYSIMKLEEERSMLHLDYFNPVARLAADPIITVTLTA